MIHVCPERQLLSVYFDGELPSPWKEKMDAHLAACPICTRQMEQYRAFSIKNTGPSAGDTALDAARQRVWQKFPASNPAFQDSNRFAAGLGSGRRVNWRANLRRSISIPVPAAAAALLLIALAFLLLFRITGKADKNDMFLASETELDAPDIVPISDMESVLQYLGSRDNGEIIILRLPESRNFINYGEPAIIKAADYSRQTMRRQPPGRQPSERHMPLGGKP